MFITKRLIEKYTEHNKYVNNPLTKLVRMFTVPLLLLSIYILLNYIPFNFPNNLQCSLKIRASIILYILIAIYNMYISFGFGFLTNILHYGILYCANKIYCEIEGSILIAITIIIFAILFQVLCSCCENNYRENEILFSIGQPLFIVIDFLRGILYFLKCLNYLETDNKIYNEI